MNAPYITENRRRSSDRRSSEITAQFPIITTQGACIRGDRRHTPERRVSSIQVKEWKVKDSIFDLLFQDKNYQTTNKK